MKAEQISVFLENRAGRLAEVTDTLAQAGIKLFGGVRGSADEEAKAFAEGRLGYDPNVKCDHHGHEHSCGGHEGHSCAGHSCGH